MSIMSRWRGSSSRLACCLTPPGWKAPSQRDRTWPVDTIIDAKCETNVKGVFAAGDCTTVPYKQIIIAAGEGAKASLSAFDYLIRTKTA